MKRTIAVCSVLLASACGDDGGPRVVLDVQDVNVTTPEDTPLVVQLAATSNRQLQVTITGQPAHGTVTNTEPTIYQYTPAKDYSGPDSVTLTFDNGIETKMGTAHIMVTPVNDAPAAGADSLAAGFAQSITIAKSTLLQNDSDVDSTSLTVTGAAPGTHGSVTMQGDDIIFTPEAGFAGQGTFTYTLSDGTATSPGNVVVAIGANAAPVATGDTQTVAEDALLTVQASALLTNDTDADHQTLAVVNVGGALHGTVNRTTSTVTFQPDANYNGPASFTYTITDGAAQSTATVTVNVTAVNDAPLVVDDNLINVTEDTLVSLGKAALLGNDSDVDGDTIRISAVSNAQHGIAALPASAVGDTVTFMPDANYNGPASFDYTVTDGTVSVTGHVTFSVASVNDAPVAVDDTRSGMEDTALTVTAAQMTTNDTDADSDPLTITGAANATHGTVTFSAGQVVFTPDPNYNGPATFDYTLSDGTLSDTGTVNLTIAAVNDAPVSANDTASTAEDVAVLIPVLTNDVDIDPDTLAVSATTTPAHGTVTVVGTSVRYTPALNYFGPDQFNYTASDGTATSTSVVNVTVTAVNDAPVASNDGAMVAEDANVLLDVLANDTDVETTVSLTGVVMQPLHGVVAIESGKIRYTPAHDYFGPDSFTYAVNDGTGGSGGATVMISVTPVNDAPVAQPDGYALTEEIIVPVATGVLSNDTDVDSMMLTAVVNTQPSYGTLVLNPDGSFTYTVTNPCADFDQFTYHVNDGFLDSQVVTVTFEINRRPVVYNDYWDVPSGNTLNVQDPGVLGFDPFYNFPDFDPDGDPISVALVQAPAHAVAFSFNNGTGPNAGGFTYTPDPSFVNDTDTIIYNVTDGKSTTQGITELYVYFSQCGSNCVAATGATSFATDKRLMEDAQRDGVEAIIGCCFPQQPPGNFRTVNAIGCDLLPMNQSLSAANRSYLQE